MICGVRDKRVKLGFFKTEERSANKRRAIRLELFDFIMVYGHRKVPVFPLFINIRL